jgi:uncharacterized protein
MRQPLVVLDTNAMVSHVWGSNAMRKIVAAIRAGLIIPLVSPPILQEFREVVALPKLARHIKKEDVRTFLKDLALAARVVDSHQRIIRCCEDPDDDMFLECACEGNADYIISGDKHLLVLNPFEGIQILSPGDFVRKVLERL